MRTDYDACYIASVIRKYNGAVRLLEQYERLLLAVNRSIPRDWADEVRREFFSLFKDSELSKQRQTSFKYFWNHCSSVITLVWIADALGIENKIVYDGMYASVNTYEKTHLKQSEAKAFRDVVTFDVVLKACEKRNLSDDLFVACSNIRKAIIAAAEVCHTSADYERVSNFTCRMLDKYNK